MAIEPQKLFNPNEHITKLPRWTKNEWGNLVKVEDDYLEVKWRLVWFRAAYPQGSIETQEMCVDLDREVSAEKTHWDKNLKKRVVDEVITAKGYARIKATVKTGDGGVGTGTKTETAVDFPDFVEKAETGAIGRALAALGYGTQFTDDEWDEAHRIVDSPVGNDAPKQPDQRAEPKSPKPLLPPDATIKAANEGLQKAGSLAKQRAMNNGLNWEQILIDSKITTFQSGKDIAAVNRIIDALIAESKQAAS